MKSKISIWDCRRAIEIAGGLPLAIRGDLFAETGPDPVARWISETVLVTQLEVKQGRWVIGNIGFTRHGQEHLTKLARDIIADDERLYASQQLDESDPWKLQETTTGCGPEGNLSARPHDPKPPFFPREQRVSPDRPAAVQGAKRRSEPLTARTDLESSRARGKGVGCRRDWTNGLLALVNQAARHFRNIFAAAILALRP